MKVKRNIYLLHVLAGLMLVTVFSQAKAQDTRALLVVNVADPQGAGVSGATVTVTQVDCQCGKCPPEIKNCASECCDARSNPPTCCIVALSRTSDEEGNTTFEVNPGKYQARIVVAGFKSAEVDGIQVGVGQSSRVQVTLEVGGIAEEISVGEKLKKVLGKSESLETLTVEVKNQKAVGSNVTVIVKLAGCACGECPAGKTCLSGCCDCRQGDCICCIVASGFTNSKGIRSFNLPAGNYDVRLKIGEESWGTYSNVPVGSDRNTKLPLTILKPQ